MELCFGVSLASSETTIHGGDYRASGFVSDVLKPPLMSGGAQLIELAKVVSSGMFCRRAFHSGGDFGAFWFEYDTVSGPGAGIEAWAC
ncbi:hypothetical protein RchiOBHm_Chr6g0295181 [Rosa chinensis]|uniref:Uncharacterized protein n=1 Tax=Rosa chinensis TaxID=74649 RepID=A0A2P6PX24_ROSCH|nr:hypothetical protein RchiOBHm_Chr6g0295181 [Rosa chinensis]